jgi:hypothetical protein
LELRVNLATAVATSVSGHLEMRVTTFASAGEGRLGHKVCGYEFVELDLFV